MFKDDFLISIIVPIYNSEETLERCLHSIKNQTYKNLQIILIDDGSVDNSYSICTRFLKEDSRFEYYQQTNKGVSIARNHGLKMAKGQYIGFCDSDDWVESDAFETMLMLCVQNDCEMSIISYFIDTPSNETVFYCNQECMIMSNKEAIKQLCIGSLFQGHVWNKLIKREIIKDCTFDTDITILEDELFLHNLLCNTINVVFQGIPKYHYWQRENSAIKGTFNENDWSRRLACDKIMRIVHDHNPECIPYINTKILYSDLWMAKKLNGNKMGIEQYTYIKNDINEVLRKPCKNLNRKKLMEAKVFCMDLKLYKIYILIDSFLSSIYRKIKKWVKLQACSIQR